MTYYEPSRIYPGGFLSNQKTGENRMLYIFRNPFFSFLFQTPEQVGVGVVNAIEKERDMDSHWFPFLAILFFSFFGCWLIRWMGILDLDYENGGCPKGEKRRELNRKSLVKERERRERERKEEEKKK